MKANERLDEQIKNKTVTITGKFETKITFLGSSCSASVNPGENIDSFSLFPGEEAVCAVQISYWVTSGKYAGWEYRHFLLQISLGDDGNPQVELEHAFVPKPDRLGQIVPEAGLTVRIGEEFFLAPLLVSSCDTEEKLTALRTQYRLVANKDANLLCRFIAGKATPEEVKAAAAELVVQTVDVPALQKKLEETEQRMGAEISKLLTELKQVSDAGVATCLAYNKLEKLHQNLLNRLHAIIDGTDTYAAAGGFWDTAGCKMKRIRSFLTEIQEQMKKPKKPV